MNEYMFNLFEGYIEYRRTTGRRSEAYKFIYDVFDNEETLLEHCMKFLEERIIGDPILLGLVKKSIDLPQLLESLCDYFDYNHIEHCDNCDTYWMEDDSDEEHECSFDINTTIVKGIVCKACTNELPAMTMKEHLDGRGCPCRCPA
jgi:hypothetical protein